MNANELIKYWENQPSNLAEQTATTLRQQADRIAELQKAKTLTDEEIVDCVDNIFGLMALQTKYVMDIYQIQQCGIELARAILRKAQGDGK
jgi:hypothetical protein